ncbi:hypothetical protein M569_16642 [Genlisea aurea]|uniref:RRM domain-containing protein n=1 Tax=Genlisea aurea TaxID=192259 RepID=S8BU91_9LAMI|nr:hypothetical protein M569_16642 [Genlisea aurea]
MDDDAWVAKELLLWKIQCFDPENASEIMSRILLYNPSDEQIVRLAVAQDSLFLSCINRIRILMGIISRPDSVSDPDTPTDNRNSPPADDSSSTEAHSDLLRPDKAPVNESGDDISRNLPDDLYPTFLPHTQPLQGTTMQPFMGKNLQLQSFSHSRDLLQLPSNTDRRMIVLPWPGLPPASSSIPMQPFMGNTLQLRGFPHSRVLLQLPPITYQRIVWPCLGLLPPAARSTLTWSPTTVFVSFHDRATVHQHVVAMYFANFGPLLKVNLKRGYGFVTYMHIESADNVLASGNPHWIQGWRFVVRPYRNT